MRALECDVQDAVWAAIEPFIPPTPEMVLMSNVGAITERIAVGLCELGYVVHANDAVDVTRFFVR